MIKGVHTMFYSSEPEALRAFLRDILGFTDFVDAGEGWLLFDIAEANMGVHPTDTPDGARSGTRDISFYCDDIEKTVVELRERGVEFTTDIQDEGWGLVTRLKVPGDFDVQLYEPRHK